MTALQNVIEAPVQVLARPRGRGAAPRDAICSTQVGLSDKADAYPGRIVRRPAAARRDRARAGDGPEG